MYRIEDPHALAMLDQMPVEELPHIPAQVYVHAYPFDFKKEDINEKVIEEAPKIIEGIRTEAPDHESFRGFSVQTGFIAEDRKGGPWEYEERNARGKMVRHSGYGPRIAIGYASNYKLRHPDEAPDSVILPNIPKNCAELSALQTLEMLKFGRLNFMGVGGTINAKRIEEVTGEVTRTLYCCDECEGTLRYSPLVDNDTLIATIGLGMNRLQVRTNGEVQLAAMARAAGLAPPPEPKLLVDTPARWQKRLEGYRREYERHGLTLDGRKRFAGRKLCEFAIKNF